MNNNIPIARWLSMFWLCSAVSLVLGQFSGSVTLNGTNGAALTVTGILGIFCTLVQFYPFYRFSRVSERLQRAFTATVLSVAATVVGLLAMMLVPSDTPPYTPSTFYLLFSLIALAGVIAPMSLSSGCTPDWTMSVQSAATTFRPSVFAGAFIFPLSTFCCACCQLPFRFFSRRLPALCCLPCLSALHIKRKS